MSRLKVARESRMSALRRTCALMEGLIGFFMSRAQGTHYRETPFCREMRNCVKTFLQVPYFLGDNVLAIYSAKSMRPIKLGYAYFSACSRQSNFANSRSKIPLICRGNRNPAPI